MNGFGITKIKLFLSAKDALNYMNQSAKYFSLIQEKNIECESYLPLRRFGIFTIGSKK